MIREIIDYLYKNINPNKYWKSKGAIIGEGTKICRLADLGTEPYLIKIGKNVRINSGVMFINHDGGVWVLRNTKTEYKDIDLFGEIEVGDNVHIGTNATIMPGSRIGSNCIIGCSALVTRGGVIPDNSVAAGVPARVIETIDDYEKKHKSEFLYTKQLSPKEKREFLLKNI